MAKEIDLAGSDERDDNRYEKAEKTGSQTNYYVGDKDTGKHCHMYKEHESGKAGVTHRGDCVVCEDGKSEKTWSDSDSTLSIVSRFFGGNG